MGSINFLPILLFYINCTLLVTVSSVNTDQLIEMLKDQADQQKQQETKESQASMLGQLLRKFLENNFRRTYYELYFINSTLSNLTESQAAFSNITENQFSNVLEVITQLQRSVDMIKIIMPQIGEIKKSVLEFSTLKNITMDVRKLRDEILSDSKKQLEGLIRLVRMSYSTALRITELHQITIQNRSCSDLLKQGERESGIYSIWPQHAYDKPVDVYCDMTTDGGGWTILQRRGVGNITKDDRPNFNRNWIEYENGFGNASSDYWLGLENTRGLTRNCPHELLINLTDWEGQHRFAHYDKFQIGSKMKFYTLLVEGHSGNCDDSLLYHNKKQFSTFDEDNDDKWGDINSSCAKMHGGGWWFGDCLKSNLNGVYPDDDIRGRVDKHKGIRWNSWTTMKYSLKKTEMKIRPIQEC